jgi:hypothetical protein
VTTAHRAKLAYIYVRQSTAGQVRQHQESTELQYRLVDRAALFGWPKERIEVIDNDLGKSGTSSDGRGVTREQRRTVPLTFSIASWTRTMHPAQGCQG